MAPPVYFVRHGQSEWNLRGLTQGQTAHPRLTDRGREQARDAAHAIAADLAARRLSAGRILSSDLRRAVETAEIVATRVGLLVECESRLREQCLGWLEGRKEDDYRAVAAQHDWSDPALGLANGESPLEVRDRVTAVVAEIDPATVTIIVSHANAIRIALTHLTLADPQKMPWIGLPNGGVLCVIGDATRAISPGHRGVATAVPLP